MSESPDVAAQAADAAAPTDEWEQIRTGLGREWAGDSEGDVLIGILIGAESVPLKEPPKDNPDRTHARAFIFADPDTGEQVFVWESHELATALLNVNVGDKVRITALGRESFSGPDGPRQVKRFKVERARSAAASPEAPAE